MYNAHSIRSLPYSKLVELTLKFTFGFYNFTPRIFTFQFPLYYFYICILLICSVIQFLIQYKRIMWHTFFTEHGIYS